jgi:tight adherence protein B
MTWLWGGTLAAGILLTISPWLWPARLSEPVSSAPRPGRRLLDAAGFAHASAGRLWVATLGAGVLAAATVFLLTSLPAVAGLAAVFGAAAPSAWLRSRARARRRSRRTLWPDVCDLLVASVRAGMSLPDSVASLSLSAPAELRPAFGHFAADLAASGHFDSAVLRLKASLGDPSSDRIIETLRMARHVGGTELTSVLRALSASVRADSTLRGEVEARQSWIRGAAVLGVVAPWLVLALLATRPEGIRAYASAEGTVLVIVGASVSLIAYRMMMRLGRLPEPRRWFG